MSFGATKMPATAALPVAPTPTDPSVEAAAAALRETQAQASGRASTILTSGMGVSSTAPVARKTLLGQ